MRFAIATVLATGIATLILPASHAQADFAVNGAVERLQSRADTAERELRQLTGRLEAMGFELNEARRLIQQYELELQQTRQRQSKLQARLEQMESQLAAMAASLADTATTSATTKPPDKAPVPAAKSMEVTGAEDRNAEAAESGNAEAAGSAEDGKTNTAPKAQLAEPPEPELLLPDDPDKLLETGQAYLFRSKYRNAELAFSKFSKQYPNHEKIAEAKYLLGETLLFQQAYPAAAAVYIDLLSAHADAPNAPDGLVKLARVMRLMNDQRQACAILSELPVRYPSASPVVMSIASAEHARSKCS